MAQGFFYTGEEGNLATRRKLYEMMQRQGTSTEPIRHWTQGLARALTGVTGVLGMDKADAEQKRVDQEAMAGILGTARPDTVSGSTGMEATAPAGASPASASVSPSPAASPAAPASFSGGSQEFISQMMPHAQRVAQQTGVDPRIVIAQAALESGWGRRAPGNNFFGIKSHGAPGGNTFATTEVVNGQPIRTRDSFRAYGSMGESADGYAQFLQRNPRYRPMLQAQGLDAQIQALGASGYATDPNYAAKIRQIASGLQLPTAPPAAPRPDSLDGGDGSDPAPMIDGRNLPDSGALAAPDLAGSFDQMRRAAPGPMDPRARSFDQITRAGAGMQPSQAMSPAPSMDSMMAGQQITQPAAPSVDSMMMGQQVARPMQAPMPQPRPNLEPPAGAQQAAARQQIAGMMGLNERDRLMMLRDEQSLAPGEADTLRAGLGGQAPTQQAPQAAAPSANPIARLREMVMGGGSASPAAQAPATAQGQPTASAAAPAAAPAPGDQRARLMQAIMNPNVSPTVRQAALMAYQNSDPAKLEASRLANEAARLGIQSSQRQLAAPVPNSPEALAAQTRAREAEADRMGLTGQARQRYALTGALPDQQSETIPAQIRTREAEAQRLGLRPGTPEYQNYALTGRFRDSPELSSADRRAIMEAEDQVPIIQNTLGQLQRARELNSQAFSGRLAGAATMIGTSGIPGAGLLVDPEKAKASREFNQIMSSQAIEAMSATLKGATTDREMAQFKEILGDPSTPPEIRQRTIDRMITLAERQMQLQQTRVQQLRGRDYFRPGGGQPGTPPAAAGSGPRRINTPEEFSALRSGDEFVAPDGSVRRKP
jgi:flagellar rod assembly protein/muramidase FlgJ